MLPRARLARLSLDPQLDTAEVKERRNPNLWLLDAFDSLVTELPNRPHHRDLNYLALDSPRCH